MNNIENGLNLSRKWRSKQFDQLVGQSLVVKLLKNSLYKSLFFPVYLFSGPRGSGKTSTARIFAMAINCDMLESFQQKPQQVSIPCLMCKSCLVMQSQSHPDFIEIDAASNTGVDNIRVLIENSAYVPVLGRKKVYLIDEAHMLSKAAFNALLKIFEEPLDTIVFMLATTDPIKIIDTVKSRCFQLFFKSIAIQDIISQMQLICKEEDIAIDKDALEVIAINSQGSLRDALNLLEQSKLIGTKITKELILDLLGHINDSIIDNIVDIIIKKDVSALLSLYEKESLVDYNSFEIFKKIREKLHSLLLQAYNKQINTSNINLFNMLDYCYSQEQLFSKTASPGLLLQSILIKLCQSNSKIDTIAPVGPVNPVNIPNTNNISNSDIAKSAVTAAQAQVQVQVNSKTSSLIVKLEEIKEPLLLSLFKQADIKELNDKICIEFLSDSELFSDIIESKKTKWLGIFKYFYGDKLDIVYNFNKKSELKPRSFGETERANLASIDNKKIEDRQSFSDKNKWPDANNLTKLFPGTIESN